MLLLCPTADLFNDPPSTNDNPKTGIIASFQCTSAFSCLYISSCAHWLLLVDPTPSATPAAT
eukprot:m.43089 g.43089  ORF g.43089 m.43089 type:complete len:62 (+) comp12909_c0_seq33:394-579(+)